ncbi:MAG: CRISPR-associated endonuclease Cas2, partial [Desulfurococcaceae archaeon]
MLILVVYDISSNEVRLDLANYLKTKGFVRVQKSFFVGRPLPSVLKDIERTLNRFIRSENDVIHIIPVPEIYVKQIKVYGKP